jgi:hypothetical protein
VNVRRDDAGITHSEVNFRLLFCLRVEARPPQGPLLKAGAKGIYVIARSAATWQSPGMHKGFSAHLGNGIVFCIDLHSLLLYNVSGSFYGLRFGRCTRTLGIGGLWGFLFIYFSTYSILLIITASFTLFNGLR